MDGEMGLMDSLGGSLSSDVIELRLPLKPDYLPVLRATSGVVAGEASFDYDEIVQIRTAVSEVFDLITKHATQEEQALKANKITVLLAVEPGKVEILIAAPIDYTSRLDSKEADESRALLDSLMDQVGLEFNDEAAVKTVVRLVKYKSA